MKIHSGRLRKAKWKLTLPLQEARRNGEIISLAESQVLRWIDEINGVFDSDDRAREIKRRIREVGKAESCAKNKRILRTLYDELDKTQFRPDYMCLVIDKPKDYLRANKGFYINGIKYERLLGTPGGIKNSTIVFVSCKVAPEIKRRIDNGRDKGKELVPAKLEAYRALACSATTPVSMPRGVLVVDECETQFYEDIIFLYNDEAKDEPVMEYRERELIVLDESDGYGLMLPSLAERWSRELQLDYVTSGCCIRQSYTKGMVFTFDFVDFAEKIAGSYLVRDVWGHEVDIRNVELILTTSMLKLWDSYPSCEAYLKNCRSNGFSFGVTKACPARLENERTTNYQFVQSYNLSDDDIDEFIAPTMDELKDILGGDYRKGILFLRGCGLTEKSVRAMPDDYIKAMMIEPQIFNDPYVQNCIYQLIKNRINEAKVGVINTHGNYSIICGDPYALCQHIFGLPVAGLLKAGEIYNKYWLDDGAEQLACFRAPMSVANNLRLVKVHRSEEAQYWYQYMNTCTLMNCWDTTTQALNGADKDGDMVMLTSDRTLVDKLIPLPTIFCAQKKAAKRIVTEDDIVKANINSFGDEIGKITNRVTSMYDVQSLYREGSLEYKELEYRIMCGQLMQQDSIDKAKGIISKPMPKPWYDWRSAVEMPEEKRDLYTSIVANKKPYFMRYIYPQLMKDYNKYIKNSAKASLREFGETVDELLTTPFEELTERQVAFLNQYRNKMPVGMNNCVMNKICRRFEAAFDSVKVRHLTVGEFDYEIMKSGVEFSKKEFDEISKLCNDYIAEMRRIAAMSDMVRTADDDPAADFEAVRSRFLAACKMACPNDRARCDIVLDICYQSKKSKKFAWDMCGEQIINNLLDKNNKTLSYPKEDENGDIHYKGLTFAMTEMTIQEDFDEYSS